MFLDKNDERSLARRNKRVRIESGIEAKARTARELGIELEFALAETMSMSKLYRELDRRGYVYNVYKEVWTRKH